MSIDMTRDQAKMIGFSTHQNTKDEFAQYRLVMMNFGNNRKLLEVF